MQPTESELLTVEHVRYESDMLGRTVIQLVASAEQGLYPAPVNWALLESYLLQTRSLTVFVTVNTRGRYDRDILISDFAIPGWPLAKEHPTRQKLIGHKDEVSARVAHLTFVRIEEGLRSWDFQAGLLLIDLLAEWCAAFPVDSPFAGEIEKLVQGLNTSRPALQEAQTRLANGAMARQ